MLKAMPWPWILVPNRYESNFSNEVLYKLVGQEVTKSRILIFLSKEIVKIMVEKQQTFGIDITIKDVEGKTGLKIAQECMQTEIINVIKNGKRKSSPKDEMKAAKIVKVNQLW